ncbi:hypothetical protein P8452_38353 [Trifolium repens]|nr:hypothetical protein P8452_38353 [Trifolium repens]
MDKMIAVGLVWGTTNAIMRRGALLWDEALKFSSAKQPHPHSTNLAQNIFFSLRNCLKLLSIWQYAIPFIINLSVSVSATFFSILSDAPLSLVVPVTNATTFASTVTSKPSKPFPCVCYAYSLLSRFFSTLSETRRRDAPFPQDRSPAAIFRPFIHLRDGSLFLERTLAVP